MKRSLLVFVFWQKSQKGWWLRLFLSVLSPHILSQPVLCLLARFFPFLRLLLSPPSLLLPICNTGWKPIQSFASTEKELSKEHQSWFFFTVTMK
ncbi:hypothetical protein BDF21DRAFT_423848 [Thamnidium elegans]|nr:hypothetical protein BDF21DRAFT_423848 [Thamnidium elegans]